VSHHQGNGAAVIERASPADLMGLASDAGSAPMQVGAVLVLSSGPDLDIAAVRALMADRVRSVPRLRQRLVETPPGCGRPVWVDEPDFDIGNHVRHLACPPPGDEQTLLALAAAVVTTPLSRARPLWSAVFVTGLADHAVGLVVIFHHVLADGIGGLAALGALVDEAPGPPSRPFPAPAPTRRRLAADAWVGRARALTRLPQAWPAARRALAELGVRRPARAARCSLNRPTGARRQLAVVRADLAAVRAAAHRHGGTVNDVMLTALTGALSTLLHARGETVDHIVVSVPVSARTSATAARLGNEVGVMPVVLPAGGDARCRLRQVATETRTRKTRTPGGSAALLAPVFRTLAACGVLRLFVDHQRLVHTFVTNLRGPDRLLRFNRATVSTVIPVTPTTGNVTVAFAVLSYAGTLTITVTADPDRMPDLPVLVAALRANLSALTGLG
jgi:diacylglycerol O-acyltransferase